MDASSKVSAKTTDSGTPRTDAEAFDFKQDPLKPYTNMLISSDGDYVPSGFARTLERELSQAQAELQIAKRDAQRYQWLRTRISGRELWFSHADEALDAHIDFLMKMDTGTP